MFSKIRQFLPEGLRPLLYVSTQIRPYHYPLSKRLHSQEIQQGIYHFGSLDPTPLGWSLRLHKLSYVWLRISLVSTLGVPLNQINFHLTITDQGDKSLSKQIPLSLCSEGFATPFPPFQAALGFPKDQTISSSLWDAVRFGTLAPTPNGQSLHSLLRYEKIPPNTSEEKLDSDNISSTNFSRVSSVLSLKEFHRISTVVTPRLLLKAANLTEDLGGLFYYLHAACA